MTVERELKMGVGSEFVMPDLVGRIDGIEVGASISSVLVATYYDTEDFALASWGVTLRHRSGEPGPAWTVKLPLRDVDDTVERRELTFTGGVRKVPVGALDLLTAFRLDRSLKPVARLRTERTSFALLRDGSLVATVCDDVVQGQRLGIKATTDAVEFREIEVELAEGLAGDDVLGDVRARLRKAGARKAPRKASKLAVVLADAFPEPALAARGPSKKAPMIDVAAAAFTRSVMELVNLDPAVRLDDDSEDLHHFRVATRRLRSELRTFAGQLDQDWVKSLRDELAWLTKATSNVRDLDVIGACLRADIKVVPVSDRAAGEELMARLARDREAAQAILREVLGSERYLTLLRSLLAAASSPKPAMAVEATTEAKEGDGARPEGETEQPHEATEADSTAMLSARRTLPLLTRKSWRKLRKAVAALGDPADEAALHEIRILTKHTRYSAEAASQVCGREAREFAQAMRELQSVLGDLQDTVITEHWLRDLANARPSLGFVAGIVAAREQRRRREFRSDFERIWKRSTNPHLREWFH